MFPHPPEHRHADPDDFTYIDKFLVRPPSSVHLAPQAPESMQPNGCPRPAPPSPHDLPSQQSQQFDPQQRSATLNEHQLGRKERPDLWLFWLLSGWAGGHRYYLVDTKVGAMLTVRFFLGGLSIPVALIDGFLIHRRMKDKNTTSWHGSVYGHGTPAHLPPPSRCPLARTDCRQALWTPHTQPRYTSSELTGVPVNSDNVRLSYL